MHQALPPLSMRLEQFRGLWQDTHSAAYKAVQDSEGDLVSFSRGLQGQLADTGQGEDDLPFAHERRVEIHELCAWADRGAARLPRVRSGLTRRKRRGRLTLVLFGRTQAGKSTIREALMGGDGGTIGTGAQRATRYVREYNWGEWVLVDTPGVGAYGAAEDREEALSAAESADLAVFVVSSDGLQEDTFQGLVELRRRNVPVLFVLNVRRDLTKRVYRDKFLADPLSVFRPDELRGHVARIRRLAAERLGLRQVAVHIIHAQAAHMSVSSDDDDAVRDDLRKASRLDRLIQALQREVGEKAVVHRLQTTADAAVCPLDELRLEARQHMSRLRGQREGLESHEREVRARLGDILGDGRDRALGKVKARGHALRSEIGEFIEHHAEHPDLSQPWKTVVARHLGKLNKELERIWEETRTALAEEIEALADEVTAADGSPLAAAGAEDAELQQYVKGLWEKVAPSLNAAASVCVWIPGVGWVLRGVFVLVWLVSLDDGREERREKLRRALDKHVDAWLSHARKHVRGCFSRWKSEVQRHLRASVDPRVSLLEGLEEDVRRLAAGFDARVRELNKVLMTSVARVLEAPDPDAISRVARQPGHRTWVVWGGCRERLPLGELGRVLGEELLPASARTRRGRLAAMFEQACVRPCRVCVVDRKEARVTLGDEEQGRQLDPAIILLAEDLTGLRVKVVKEG